MKHIKTVEIPAKTIEVVDFVTCDICGIKIDGTDELQVYFASYDICGKCFEEKFVPAMHLNGTYRTSGPEQVGRNS